MKSILDQSTRDEIANRILLLNENSIARWGKMNVYQMVRHCILWEEMMLGKRQYKQSLPGKIFGKMALKSMLQDKPMKQGLPTVPSFKIKDNGNLAEAKAEWLHLLSQHSLRERLGFTHPFFGKLTAEQAGIIAYKHTDHHLKQFNC